MPEVEVFLPCLQEVLEVLEVLEAPLKALEVPLLRLEVLEMLSPCLQEVRMAAVQEVPDWEGP